jgi:aromatic ring-cleaving dioxygenase
MSGNRQGQSDDRNQDATRAPGRRDILRGGGLLAVASVGVGLARQADAAAPPSISPATLAARTGRSPWGYETDREPTPQPHSVRPGEATGLPAAPRAYTDIKSYHAHIYFDEDSYEKAALIRKWVAERFEVELGNWNPEPRGPHVTPSFYFGFTPELQPVILPWLQLNSLGLTILIHPNTDDPRADHLYYALWVNRSQPVNAYGMKKPDVAAGEPAIEQTYPNTRPSIAIEKG